MFVNSTLPGWLDYWQTVIDRLAYRRAKYGTDDKGAGIPSGARNPEQWGRALGGSQRQVNGAVCYSGCSVPRVS